MRTEVYARVRNGPESKLIPSISSGLSARVTRRPWEDSTQNKAIHLVIMALLCWQCAAAGGPGIATIQTRDLIRGIPPRPGDALTGSDFVAYVSKLDPRQREMAIRFGINLVMYALTGNYKTDQVHVPALLERLGQGH